MKKLIFILFATLQLHQASGQLTGNKDIPGDYATIEAAIAALNSVGVAVPGVTFNVSSNHTETFSGPTVGTITTATSSASAPVIFQKSGTGNNPLITAAVLTAATATDGVIKIVGSDYITFDGIDIQENSANTTYLTDWAYAILKSSGTNGAQHITIKNCSISLNKANTASYGIYSHNHNATSTATFTVTDLAGANSFNKIDNVNFSNVYGGIYMYGYAAASPYAYYDQNNEIGVTTGNNWANFGGGTTTAYGLYGAYQNNFKIANNTFSGPIGTNTSSGSLYCIYLSTGLNSSLDIYNNTVSLIYNGTGTFYGMYSLMGASGTSNVTNIYNNTVTGCSIPNATSGVFYGIYTYGGMTANWYNNSITNNYLGSGTTTATGSFYGLYTYTSPTSAGTANVYNNTISNNARLQSTLGSGFGYWFYQSGGNGTMYIYDNLVDNNTAGSNSTQYVGYCLYSGTKYYYDNVISNFYNANATVYGLYNGNGVTGYFYRNKFFNINSNAAASIIYGIYQSSGTSMYYYNNYISDLKTPSATGAISIAGIYLVGGTTLGCYNNSIYLHATSSGSSFGTAGIYASTTPMVDLRNNIVVNMSTPGATGFTVALRYTGTSLTNFASTSNYNDYFSGTPGAGRLIFYDGTNSDQTLADFKGRVSPRESSSVSENPPFENVEAAPYDLHVQTSSSTQLESGGIIISTPVAIMEDFDTDPRYPNTGYPDNPSSPASAPDIGADEFGGLALDVTPPNLIFAPLANTSSTAARTLTTDITDATGVPSSGIGLPVLYWRINSGTWTAVTANFVAGNQYDFTFGAGTVLGDVVSYYFVSQDLVTPTPNVGANPSGGAGGYSINPPACSTPPTTPYSYTIVGTLSGVYPVGVGQVYPTLTAAIADLNMKEVIAPVTFELWDTNYPSETFPLVIYPYAGTDPVRPVTFKPKAGVTPTITGAPATGIITLHGCQNIILDGSNTTNGTDKSLTWENTNAASNAYVIGVFNYFGTGASNCTIKNCNIKASSQITNNTYGIILNAAGGGYDNIVIENNSVLSARIGIQFGGVVNNPVINGKIINNMVGSVTDAQAIQYRGIVLSQADNTLIQGNEIMGALLGNSNTYQSGIYITAGSTNSKIIGNKIHDFFYTGTGGYGNFGIYYGSDASTTTIISNNVIYAIKSDGDPGSANYIPSGIYVYSGGNLQIYHNSINLYGATLSASYTTSYSTCINIYNGISNLDIRNNILKNSMTTASGSGSNLTYAIRSGTANTVFTNIDYNDYWVDGINPNIGYLGGNQSTLPLWQLATAQDLSSQNLEPMFASITDFHPTNFELDNKGSYVEFVPGDITGANRSDPPDIGAYEFDGDLVFRSKETVSGRTYYDLQSENALSNRIALHPDGTIGMVWTRGVEIPDFPDRGTGYNFFDGTSWGQEPNTRIENMQCGWPSYDTWGENGEIVVSHDGTSGLQINKHQNRGSGAWEASAFSGPAGLTVQWPRLVTSGANHEWIHLICNSNGSYNGQPQAMLYSRSNDGGATWDPQNIILPGTGADYYTSIDEDDYTMADHGNTVAILVSSAWKDLFIMKSTDNGATWNKTVIWQHPYPMFDWDITSTSFFYCVDNSASVAIGPDGKVHVVFGITRVLHYWPGTYYDYWPVDGIGYWNEDMEPFSNDLNALCPPDQGCSGSEMVKDYNYIGWSQDMNNDGVISYVAPNGRPWTYRSNGNSTMPSIAVDSSNNVFVAYASTTETYNNGSYDFKKIWMRAYDNWKWGEFYHVTADSSHDEEESVYPVISLNSDDNIHLFYQADATPGIAVDGAHAYQENRIIYARVPKNNLLSLYTWTGAQDTTWNKSGNWTRNLIPGGTASIIIPGIPPNQPVLNNNAICKKLTLQNGSELIVNKDKQLVITDSLIIEQDNPADPTLLTIKGEIRIEAGKAPGAPINPSPADGAVIQYWDLVLSWTCSDPDGDPLTFDVYFDTLPDPTILIASNLSSPYFAYADSLLPAEYYYWKVIAHDNRTRSTEGQVWSFSTINAIQPCPGMPVITYEGKDYHTVQIAGQCWMRENLDVGTKIEGGSGPSNNEVIEKYCYNNDSAYCNIYGGLYTWDEMMQYVDTAGAQGICPAGWHIPTLSDMNLLISYLGGTDVAGMKMKESGYSHWNYPNAGSTNESGFTALPAGLYNGYFGYQGSVSHFYTSSEDESDNSQVWLFELSANENYCFGFPYLKTPGYSVRCINDVVINQAPAAPSDPVPANNSTSQQLIITLSWACTDLENDPLTFDIYFDTVPEPVVILASDTSAFTYFIADSLQPLTTYYWKVVAHDIEGNTTIGNTWQFTTGTGWQCGDSLLISHIAGIVAPVDKNVTYGTVTNIPGETAKCWITSNLGADHQATAVDDATEASSGWYWQFNRMQGYKHDGATRTPNTTWISDINENSDWIASNDPCNLELGNSWRLPTNTEWTNVDASGGWTNWNDPWNSALKMHAAGYLHYVNGTLYEKGSRGYYWSSSQMGNSGGWSFDFYSDYCYVLGQFKAFGFSARCICEPAPAVPAAPSPGTHVPSETQIIWNWTSVAGATGYKWNTINDYTGALNTGTNTFITETSLTCGTNYSRYAWAYNTAGHSASVSLAASTLGCGFTCGNPFTDSRDGKSYNTVLIGTQCWMAQNLNVGTMINHTQEQSNNSSIDKYCYDNLESNCEVYGGLYQWGEMVQYLNGASNTTSWNPAPLGNVIGICPSGWHIPSVTEWAILSDYLGGWSISGGKMKESGLNHWAAPNTGATNQSGFTGLPGGARYPDLYFAQITLYADFWSSSQYDALNASQKALYYDHTGLFTGPQYDKRFGYSVRCLKD